jgi:NADH-quinone oxidoreductase subunit M
MIAAFVILFPIVVGIVLFAFPRGSHAPRWIGVVTALVAFALLALNAGAPDATLRWLSRPFTATFHVGFTGPGYGIALLLALVTACALLALNMPRGRDFTINVLFLEGAMTGVFLAKDLLLFALFWDLMLVPVFLVLVGWGAPHGRSAWKYLIYNFTGGLLLLLATAAFGAIYGTTDVIGTAGLPAAAYPGIAEAATPWILGGFAIAFLVKTPAFPFHTWMPDTYADAPPQLAAIISAVQSKAGLYGFLVIGLPLFAPQMHAFATPMIVLGLIGLVYGAVAALVERDVKRIAAYSSLSHLGLMLVGIFSFEPLALAGVVVYIIAHGLFNAALFLVLGFVETREETRDLRRLGGIAAYNPRLAGALILPVLAALGLPGLAGFAGELLILTGMYRAGLVWPAAIALIPIVLAAAYMLRAFQGTMQGPRIADLPERRDLTWLEGIAIAPLVAAFVFLGVDPAPITSAMTNRLIGVAPPPQQTSFNVPMSPYEGNALVTDPPPVYVSTGHRTPNAAPTGVPH